MAIQQQQETVTVVQDISLQHSTSIEELSNPSSCSTKNSTTISTLLHLLIPWMSPQMMSVNDSALGFPLFLYILYFYFSLLLFCRLHDSYSH